MNYTANKSVENINKQYNAMENSLPSIAGLPIIAAQINGAGQIRWSSELFGKFFKSSLKNISELFDPSIDLKAKFNEAKAFNMPLKICEEFKSLQSYSFKFIPNSQNDEFGFFVLIENTTELEKERLTKQILLNISHAEITCKDLESFFSIIQQELNTLFDAQNFFIVLWDKLKKTLKLSFFKDKYDSFDNFPSGKTISSYVIENEKSLLTTEVEINRLCSEGAFEIIGTPAKAWMGVPLKSDDDFIGIMVVQSYLSTSAYTRDDLRLMEHIADQIAIALKRKEREESLKISKEKAIEADKLKSTFLANMSHEIRTPMNSIVGFSELITRKTISTEKKEIYANYIGNSSKSLLALIDDIIDIAKIEAGQLKIIKSAVQVNGALNELQTYYCAEIKRDANKNIDLKTHQAVDNDNFAILCDPIRLKQILTNLISNALKFTIKGLIEVGYVIPNNATIIFYVQDSGIGISHDKQSVIFDRFRQGDDSITRKYGGTGLGLAISKKLVELMGGRIWVESEADRGATFYFSLPLIIPNASEWHFDGVQRQPSGSFMNLTILIAEDEDLNFMFLQEVLSPTKVNIIRALNGKEAIEMVKSNPKIDVVLMDIQMPILNGYAATQEIVAFRPELPVIAQTAYAMAEDRAKGFRAGCRDYISKPIRPEDLLEILKKHLGKVIG